MPQSYGVDISSNNVHPIAWSTLFAFLKGLGGGAQPFVIIKATQGTGYVNGDLKADIAAAKAAGFAVAAYLMDQGNDNVASEEALFKQVCEGLPQFNDDELPEGDSTSSYIAHLKQLDAQDPGADDYLNQSEVAAGYSEGAGLWLAEYNGEPDVVSHPCEMHQYTNNLTVPGCAGVFDANKWLGTPARFAVCFAYVTGAAPAAPTPLPSKEQAMTALNRPIIDDADHIVNGVVTGYWLVGQDGGLFAFGSAEQLGFPATVTLKPGDLIVSMKPSLTGNGLRLVGSNGGVYCLGDAPFFGSLPGDNIAASTEPIEA
jgi:Glycosyl hydrolases family 25